MLNAVSLHPLFAAELSGVRLEEITAEAFVYRHPWRLGDLVAWDNLATMHRGTPFDDTRHPRDMRRTTVLER